MFEMLPFLAQSSSSLPAWFAGVGIVWLLLALVLSVVWLWMLIDCLASSLPTGEKVLWFFVILFLHFIGAVVYWLVARPRGGHTGSHGTPNMMT